MGQLNMCHNLPRIGYKMPYNREVIKKSLIMNSGTSSTELNDMLTNFVDYVDSFYGVNDPLYPMMSQETKQPLTKFDIYRATEYYLAQCSDDRVTNCTWGDGDSLDRERVRDILLEEYNYKFVGE